MLSVGHLARGQPLYISHVADMLVEVLKGTQVFDHRYRGMCAMETNEQGTRTLITRSEELGDQMRLEQILECFQL